jgi:hypothetical protein
MCDPMPADCGVACPQDSVREYKIDDDEDDDASGNEDIRGDDDGNGVLVGGPD